MKKSKPTPPRRSYYIRKRSVRLMGHRTSVSVEDEFWDAMKKIAQREKKSVDNFVTEVDLDRPPGVNLSSAIRLVVLRDLIARAESKLTISGTVAPISAHDVVAMIRGNDAGQIP